MAAVLGLPPGRNYPVEMLVWLAVQDNIGPANLWPRYYVRLIWREKTLNYPERFMLCVFLLSNGCDPDHICDLFEVRNLLRDAAAVNHVNALIAAMENDKPVARKWFAWNIEARCTLHVDGTRHYRGAEGKYTSRCSGK